MKKMAFLFPGVGSQYTGMSQSLYDHFNIFKETIQEASDILQLDIPALSFLPENKQELDRLENAQSILLAFSIAAYRVYMQEIGIAPHFCLGHSLGEYSALCSAGVIDFGDALRLVRERGAIVNEVSAALDGTMAWVINLDIEIVEGVCKNMSKKGAEVYVSAYDSPSQTSISGHSDTLMTAARQLEKEGAIVYPLKFNGPFHSPLMKEAAEKMRAVLEQHTFQPAACPVIANRSVQPYGDADSVKENLSLQLISPIRWKDSIEYIIGQGVEMAVEIGPKNVLKFLAAKNSDSLAVFTTDNAQDFELLGDELLIKEEEYLHIMGRCLGAAVSTKNRGESREEYQEKVVKPYRKIESLYNRFAANGEKPTKEHVQEALQTLRSILAAKKVPQQEQTYWLDRVCGNKILREKS